MRLGFVEPHLAALRRDPAHGRVREPSRRRGHDVTFYLPDDVEQRCSWMRCDAAVKPITAGFGDELDVVLFNHEPQWHAPRALRARAAAGVLRPPLRPPVRQGGQLGERRGRRSISSSPTATGPPTRSSPRPATGRSSSSAASTATRSSRIRGRKRYPLLCSGEQLRAWKGTDTILVVSPVRRSRARTRRGAVRWWRRGRAWPGGGRCGRWGRGGDRRGPGARRRSRTAPGSASS